MSGTPHTSAPVCRRLAGPARTPRPALDAAPVSGAQSATAGAISTRPVPPVCGRRQLSQPPVYGARALGWRSSGWGLWARQGAGGSQPRAGLQGLHKASTGFSHGSPQPLGPPWATGGTAVSPLGPTHPLIFTLPSLGPGRCHQWGRGTSRERRGPHRSHSQPGAPSALSPLLPSPGSADTRHHRRAQRSAARALV